MKFQAMSPFDEFVQMCASAAREAREFWLFMIDSVERMSEIESAFQKYAASLGVDSLTPEQRRQAFFDHVIKDRVDEFAKRWRA